MCGRREGYAACGGTNGESLLSPSILYNVSSTDVTEIIC